MNRNNTTQAGTASNIIKDIIDRRGDLSDDALIRKLWEIYDNGYLAGAAHRDE